MKITKITFFLLLIGSCSFSQFTEIKPGIVLPQMTTAQRTGIVSPANGMLVFDSNTQSYWFRQSGAWVELPKGGSTSNYWQLNGLAGNEIKNTNSGGFWSANPTRLTFSANDASNPPTAPVQGNGTRLMWISNRSAFRVGSVDYDSKSWDADSIGIRSFAAGNSTKATGSTSTAFGTRTIAEGNSSTTMGVNTRASGDISIAMGGTTIASGTNSTAMGLFSEASAYVSTAMGNTTKALGFHSTAMGNRTEASGENSMAMGNETEASATDATAMGANTVASGSAATAMGNSTVASGFASTAMGDNTSASGTYSTAMGSQTNAYRSFSTAMGYKTIAGGFYSTAMGYYTKALGNYSTSMGIYATADGNATTAIGTYVTTNGWLGSMVLGDYITPAEAASGDSLYSTNLNQFSARFEKGYRLYTDNNLSAATNYGVFMNNRANSWSSLSDSTKKERFLSYNPQKVLNSVAAMRVGTWNYKGDDRPEGRHWGVMAQDFYHHFGKDEYGTIGSDTLIASADFDGVSFAAIKALELRTRELQEENVKLKVEGERLKASLIAKDEKYMQLFAELKAEMAALKNSGGKEVLSAKAEK